MTSDIAAGRVDKSVAAAYDANANDCAACPRQDEPTPVPPRAQAAHQEAAHMVRQIERRLRGVPLLPYSYRDFGSLVSLGKHSTVGNLMGLFGRGFFIEGLFAGVMYRSLRMLHE